jgi:hypothetical protein
VNLKLNDTFPCKARAILKTKHNGAVNKRPITASNRPQADPAHIGQIAK